MKTRLIQAVINQVQNAENDYETLGLFPNASLEEILKAYQKLILKCHPDKVAEQDTVLAKELFEKVTQAKDKLTNHRGNRPVEWKSSEKVLCAHEAFCNGFYKQLESAKMTFVVAGLAELFGGGKNASNEATLSKEKNAFDFSNGLISLLSSVVHETHAFCLGMNLAWIHSVMNDSEIIFLRSFKAGYQYKTLLDLYEFASLIHPFVEAKDLENRIDLGNLGQCFDDLSPDKDLYMSTPTHFGWNFQFDEFIAQLIKQTQCSINIPFLIHNRKDKESRFISLVFDGINYKVFSPYAPLLNEKQNDFALHSKDDMMKIMKQHYYSESSALKQSIIITSFMLAPIELKPQKNEVIPLNVSPSDLILHDNNFVAHVLKEYYPSSQANARFVLTSIRDGHLTGLFKQVYENAPEHFTQAILHEFLRDAVENNNIHMPVELCFASPRLQNSLVQYYFNYYLANTITFEQLPKIIELFKPELLGQSLSDENRNNNQFFQKHLDEIIHNLHLITALVEIKVKITPDQMDAFLSKISPTLLFNAQHKKSWIGEYQEKLNQIIEVLQNLSKNGYTFLQKNIRHAEELLAYALIFGEQNEFFIELANNKAITIDLPDPDGKFLLNHCSGAKNWSMVDVLSQLGAPYATGKQISLIEIPPLHAWLEGVEALHYLHVHFTQEDWMKVEMQEGDFFAILLKNRDTPEPLIHHFKQMKASLKLSQVSYAYHCLYNPVRLKNLLKAPGLPQHSNSGFKLKEFCQQDYIQVEELQSHEILAAQPLPNLIGLSLQEAEKLLLRHQASEICKISSKGKSDFYYSWNKKLDTVLTHHAMPFCYQHYFNYLKSLIQNSNQALDVGAVINTATQIYNDILMLPKMTDLNKNDQPLGLQLRLNAKGLITDCHTINNLYLRTYGRFINKGDFICSDMGSQLVPLKLNLKNFICECHVLHHILSSTTPLRFSTPTSPKTLDDPYILNILMHRWKAVQ